METRPLGKNGLQVPVIGFGAWPIGGGMGPVEEESAKRTLHHALDSGVTLVDTAEAYRTSESVIGRASEVRCVSPLIPIRTAVRRRFEPLLPTQADATSGAKGRTGPNGGRNG